MYIYIIIVTDELCDQIVRFGHMYYALNVFVTKQTNTSKVNPKILSSALDTLIHISYTSTSNNLNLYFIKRLPVIIIIINYRLWTSIVKENEPIQCAAQI